MGRFYCLMRMDHDFFLNIWNDFWLPHCTNGLQPYVLSASPWVTSNHLLTVNRWLQDQSWMLREAGMWYPHQPHFTPSLLICRYAPKNSNHEHPWVTNNYLSTFTWRLSDAQLTFGGKLNLSKASRWWASDNRPCTIGGQNTLGCQSLMDSNFICCVHPWTDIKFYFHPRSPRGWLANPRGCPWASMIVSQPSVNHPHRL